MGFGEFLGSGSSSTKLLLRFENNTNDSSGNNVAATVTNLTYSQPYGMFKVGARFYETSPSTFRCPNVMGTGNINFTFRCNFYVSASQTRGELFCIGNYAVTNAGIMFSVRAKAGGNNAIYFDYANSAGSSTNTRVVYNKWNSLYITKNGSTIKITLNGVTETFTKAGLNISGTLMYIGYYGSTTAYFIGYLDEVLFENTVWSQEKVMKDYTKHLGRFGIF